MLGLATCRRKKSLDFIGAAAATSGLILLTFVLSSGEVYGWSTSYIIVILIIAVALLAAFPLIEKYVKDPIMPNYLWKQKGFAATWVVGFLVYCWWQTLVRLLSPMSTTWESNRLTSQSLFLSTGPLQHLHLAECVSFIRTSDFPPVHSDGLVRSHRFVRPSPFPSRHPRRTLTSHPVVLPLAATELALASITSKSRRLFSPASRCRSSLSSRWRS